MTDRAAYFLEHGHPPEAAKRACIDFDGTLYPKVGLFDAPEPLEGAVEAVQRLKRAGYDITIWTSRLSAEWLDGSGELYEDQADYIERLLTRDGIPYDRLVGKPIAEVYVDDIALRFAPGDWPAITDWILFAGADA